jgi:type I restriction enzyme S subunit
MSEGNGLPQGWAEATVGALCGFITSGSRGWASHYSEEGSIFLRIGNLDHDSISLDMRSIQCVRPPAGAESDRTCVKSQDILVSVTADVGMIGVVPNGFGTAYINQHIALCRPLKGCYSPYIAWFLTSRRGQKQFKEMQRGATKVGLGLDDVRNATVPIAPLPEQHRIVEKIEELFSDLDAGVASLQRAKANLKRYRASVLKSAVEGRLTEEWRKEHPQAEDGQMLLDRVLRERREKWEKDQLLKFKEKGKEPPKNWESKYEEPSAPDTSELPELPDGWVWATVGCLITHTQNGFGKRSQDAGQPTVVLRLADVTDGEICLADTRRVNATVDEIQQYGLEPNDLLAIRVNGSPDLVGRFVRFVDAKEPVLFCDHFIQLRTPLAGLARYLRYFADTRAVRHFVEENKVCSAGQNTVSQSTLMRLPVPLPPLAEQEQIVALVEERLSQIDSAEKTIDSELIRSKRLRQSILKTAFEGKLVPQDPKDEPASVLLERIKATREREQPKKKAKKVKA